MDGNKYVTVIGSDASRYIDTEGKIKDVDNTLIESNGKEDVATFSTLSTVSGYRNSANSYSVFLRDDFKEGEGDLYTVFTDEYAVGIEPIDGDYSTSSVSDNAIRYNNVFDKIDVQYTVLGNSVKEDIILLDKQEKNSFEYKLNTYGLKAKLINNTVYVYEDGSNPETESVFIFDAPLMEDASGDINFGIIMKLTNDGDSYKVTVEADTEWLEQDERVYPVRIDPSAIQVPKNAIHIACVEEGSPNHVIGDNGYPYVGNDDGKKSRNLAVYKTKHKNCRSYFNVDFDFSSLGVEPQITNATFTVTQMTNWSRGESTFGLYEIDDAWNVNKLTWNTQVNYAHSFIQSQQSAQSRKGSLSYDVTDTVTEWINGTKENNGFVMKASKEAPAGGNEVAGSYEQCEVLYNNAYAEGPKLVVSWTGELTELDTITLDDTTIEVYPVISKDEFMISDTLGVVAHGLAKPGSTVHYELINSTTGKCIAKTTLLYPDSYEYASEYPEAISYKRSLSNWQSEVFGDLNIDQIYYVTAYAEEKGVKGKTVTSDSFLIYEENGFDLLPRIATHYGVEVDTILSDMKMQDELSKRGNRLFIRNPKHALPYIPAPFTELERMLIDGYLLGSGFYCMFGFEPINLNTGNFYMSQTDTSIDEINGAFEITRTYNSKGATLGSSLGNGWTFEYDERLGRLADNSIIWIKNDGAVIKFTKTGDGFESPAGMNYTLEETDDEYVITNTNDGSKKIFSRLGLLTALEDVQGNHVELRYDLECRLTEIITPSGKSFKVDVDDQQRITKITQPDNKTIEYIYDDNNNLVKVTNPSDDNVKYTYDDNHLMTAWYDENGHQVVSNTYDKDGRVTKQTDANGENVKISYADGTTTTTDACGNTTHYYYDAQGRTTKVVYPDKTSEVTTYNSLGYPEKIIDRSGVSVTSKYNERGKVLSQTREDGKSCSYTWNEHDQITSFTDYDGSKTGYSYDDRQRLTSVEDAEGGVTSYSYDDMNRMISMTDANGNTTSYSYDGACITAKKDALGNTWNYTYDAMNRQLTITDPLGNTTQNKYNANGWNTVNTDANKATTVYDFDKAGLVTAITDKNGHKSTFTYDKKNHMLSGTDPLGNTLIYTYDANGNKTSETDAEKQKIIYAYDEMNRLVSRTDANGKTTSYKYDNNDNIVSVIDRRGNETTNTYDNVTKALTSYTDANGNVTIYSLDAKGRVTKIVYADGSKSAFTYDKLGRTVSTTDQIGLVTNITYDKNGNVVKIKDDENRVYTYEYDALNQLVKTTDPLNNVTKYEYDKAGRLTSTTDGRGNTTSYSYDALGRLVSQLDALKGSLSYVYDNEGNILSETNPMSSKIEYVYDEIGQLTSKKDAFGNETSYAYDKVSRLLSETDSLKGITSYTYDKNSNLSSITDALKNGHTYITDEEGNLLEDKYPNGDTETYTYDKNGNPVTHKERYGIVTTFTYDNMNRIVKSSDTAGNLMTFTYDGAGNVLTQTDVMGRSTVYTYDKFGRPETVTGIDNVTTSYEYDPLDRLIKITDGEGKVTAYTYDAVGNLVHTVEPGNAEYDYTYDELNRLTVKVDPVGGVTKFAYDKNGNLVNVTDGNGVVTQYTYDIKDRLETYTDGNGGNTSYKYDALDRLVKLTTPEGLGESYTYDAVGNLTVLTDGLGNKTSYEYDRLYRLVSKTSPMGAKESYTYDKHDVVTSVTDALGKVTKYTVNKNGQVTNKRQPNGASYSYTYDAVHRLTSVKTPLGYKTEFAYNDGNDILTQNDNLDRTISFTYDIMHRITSVTDAEGGVTSYSYDERGNRSEIVDALGYTWSYTYDKVDQMIRVVDPEKKACIMIYDFTGNITKMMMPGKRIVQYEYDGNYNRTSYTDPKGYVYSYNYDKDDRLTGTKDPLKQTTGYQYDAVNRVTSITDKMKLTQSFTYDAHGNVLTSKATDGLVTSYTYDIKNRLTSVTDPMGSVAYYTYDVMDNLTGVKDYLGRGTTYTYDVVGNRTSITDVNGRKELFTYDIAGRLSSYTSNGGNVITYDYDKIDNLVEKSYSNVKDAENQETTKPVHYAYDALGQRINMYDATGETAYTYDGLGRIKSVITYRTQNSDGSVNLENGDEVGYTYNDADQLSEIKYPDGTKVSYKYDLNGNLIKVTDREGNVTTYKYDAINRVKQMHRPNGISTYITYNARDQITELENKCDDCDWIVSKYVYTYNDSGYIETEKAIESLAGYAYDDKHAGKHTDGRHDELYPHGTKHNGKHTKDADFAYQIVETDRSFVYDKAGKLIESTETEDNYGTYTYTYEYDLMGNRIAVIKKDSKGKVAESKDYTYNESNQLISEKLYDGKKRTTLDYEYDADGNRISEIGKIGTTKVEKHYQYSVENRLEAVYEKDELLMAAAYDGDGNRVFQLNYNLHTDDDWKGNSGNGNGNNKDNKGSGNNGVGNSKSEGTDDAGYGNATNAQEHNSQNQSGILFPISAEESDTEAYLISLIKIIGKEKNYELIEYINDVNREHTEVLVEQNINGKLDTAYVYGNQRLSLDRFDGSTGYYLYDPRGSVTGITNEKGQIYQSYRYSVYGEVTFGKPQYENEYTYNGESYNPNIESQYLRARYYNVVNAEFLTEDSYLGELNRPLTLNRYNYCISNAENYHDPSGNVPIETIADVAGLVVDVGTLIAEPSWANAGWVVLDVVSIVVPYMPGAYAFKAAGKVGDAAKVIDKVTDGLEFISTVDHLGHVKDALYTVEKTVDGIEVLTEVVKFADTASDTGKLFNRSTDLVRIGKLVQYSKQELVFANNIQKYLMKVGFKYALREMSEKAIGNANNNSCSDFETSYGKSTLISLKYTENFTDSAIEHIFEGQVNARGKAVGYHYEGVENTAGKVIAGTESAANNLGVYQAQVEVNGIAKGVNNGYSSSFFPKNMNPQEVINNINQAYTNRVFIRGNRYRGISSGGIEIEMFLDNNNKIISAFPIY